MLVSVVCRMSSAAFFLIFVKFTNGQCRVPHVVATLTNHRGILARRNASNGVRQTIHGLRYYMMILSSVVLGVTLMTHSGSSIAQSASAILRSDVFEERRLLQRKKLFAIPGQIT